MNEKVSLEVNGIKYLGFMEMNYSKSIEDLGGVFSFTASTEKNKFTPFKGQEKCRVYINDYPLITGYIESMNYSYNENSHEITINGRDKTCDIIDNSVVGDIDFTAPFSLENLIRNVLDLAGLDEIKIINYIGEVDSFQSNEKLSNEVGENMFDFLEKYCRKRGVLLTSDGDGDLVITRAGDQQLNTILLNEIDGNGGGNNIKNASINYDFSNRYYGYICKSQKNPSTENFEGIVDDLGDNPTAEELQEIIEKDLNFENQVGTALDNEMRKTRILEFQNETSSPVVSNQERAKWEANIRRTRSLVYNCEVNYVFADEKNTAFFMPNKLIAVRDDFLDINALMLIKSVNYNISVSSGTSVKLQLVPKDAYKPMIQINTRDSKYNKVGTNVSQTAVAPTTKQVSEFEFEKAYYKRSWGI